MGSKSLRRAFWAAAALMAIASAPIALNACSGGGSEKSANSGVNLKITPTDHANILSWDAVHGAKSYKLYWKISDAGGSRSKARTGQASTSDLASMHPIDIQPEEVMYIHNGLINGRNYEYVLTASLASIIAAGQFTNGVPANDPCSELGASYVTGSNGTCVNLGNDPQNCGRRDTICPSGALCVRGGCTSDNSRCRPITHAFGSLWCSEVTTIGVFPVCVTSDWDRENCGACGNRCANGEICSFGQCAAGSCPAGQVACQGGADPGAIRCVDPLTDRANCGACDNRCEVMGANNVLYASWCTNGVCDPTGACPAPNTACYGSCVDTQRDSANCGACGVQCGSGQSCNGGTCVGGSTGGGSGGGGTTTTPPPTPPPAPTCSSGQTMCGSTCVNLFNDAGNCGGCGVRCASGICSQGWCAPAPCAAGLTNCGGLCVDVKNDANNCGSCGYSCSSLGFGNGLICASGICGLP